MRAVVMHEPGNVTVEEMPMPTILEPTDAIIKLAATCICGSDLWPYRGLEPVHEKRMGHEYVGTVVEVGAAVTTVKPGDFVVGSFCISCGECAICRAGYPSRCTTAAAQGDAFVSTRAGGTQAEYARVALADGTLVKTPEAPTPEQLPSLLAASDVLCTGWFAPTRPGPPPGRPSSSWVTAPWAWAQSLAPSSWVRPASSRCRATRTARRWPASSERPTSSKSAARRASRASRN